MPRRLPEDDTNIGSPVFTPDGRAVVYLAGPFTRQRSARLLRLDAGAIVQLPEVQTLQGMVVLANAVLFSKGIDLLAAPFSLDNADPLGDPVMVIASMGESAFALTPGGVLVYDPRLGGDERTFVWVDPSGKEEATGIRPREYTYGRISPDGSRAVFDRRGWDNDLWVWSFGPRTEIRLTSPPTVDS